jgi:hypothetical protein
MLKNMARTLPFALNCYSRVKNAEIRSPIGLRMGDEAIAIAERAAGMARALLHCE